MNIEIIKNFTYEEINLLPTGTSQGFLIMKRGGKQIQRDHLDLHSYTCKHCNKSIKFDMDYDSNSDIELGLANHLMSCKKRNEMEERL
jgi:hypothetical protein